MTSNKSWSLSEAFLFQKKIDEGVKFSKIISTGLSDIYVTVLQTSIYQGKKISTYSTRIFPIDEEGLVSSNHHFFQCVFLRTQKCKLGRYHDVLAKHSKHTKRSSKTTIIICDIYPLFNPNTERTKNTHVKTKKNASGNFYTNTQTNCFNHNIWTNIHYIQNKKKGTLPT
ncbi:hypothetical protein BDA99DRAFT_539198 [Phascolomyces articulosus]|uniref:Uncharacterized protein n=1 Tax=Phascolomyces articulosus TaxID=60185 RepID=A0AAD5PE21_9FUNG|nr:hypothetical protein BDA99DRAFT_539198 [Phascolomyces articulosus]